MKRNAQVWRLSLLSLGLVAAGFHQAALAQSVTTDVGTVKITGSGDALANGLLIDEDGVKAKSTVTRSAIEKERSSSNPFQLLNLLPGVNANSQDATGDYLFAGFRSNSQPFTGGLAGGVLTRGGALQGDAGVEPAGHLEDLFGPPGDHEFGS